MNQRRLSGDEIRAVMLANARQLMSSTLKAKAPERHGERKPMQVKPRSDK